MSNKLKIELSPQYAEHLELIKQIIPSETGEQITDDSKMVEVLIDSFMAFIQEQVAYEEHAHDGGCCGGGGHDHGHSHEHGKEEGGCCKH